MSELNFKIRKAEDADVAGLTRLIGDCFAEYEGCVLDLEGIDKPMLAIASYVDSYDGEFWVVLSEVSLVGYIIEDGKMELIKLYVDKTHRRQGLASRLLSLVLDAAAKNNIELDLWSDTRFVEAHAFYSHHGFEKQDETRFLHDPSNSWEFHFTQNSRK